MKPDPLGVRNRLIGERTMLMCPMPPKLFTKSTGDVFDALNLYLTEFSHQPSIAELSIVAECSQGTVVRALKKMERANAIEVIRNGNGYKNRYRILIEEV